MFSRALLKYWLPEGYYPGRSNLDALGIFGACYKLSVLMTLAVQAFRYAFEPFFFSKSDSEEAAPTYSNVMNGFIIFGCLAWMAITLVLPELAPVFLRNPIYLEGLGIVPILLGAGLLLGIYYNLSVWYKLTDKTHLGAVVSVAGALVTIGLNIALIPLLGYHGSAWASVFTYLVMILISYLWGRKYYRVPYHVVSATGYFLLASGIVFALANFDMSISQRYAFGGGMIVVFGLAAYFIEVRHYQKENG